ncbi:MAG TPA: glycosyl hydrolase 108 family protein [Porticoccaceae bacterium]|jgi:Putative secretion activating protein
MNFDQCFERLIGHEGGYSNHPNDPGGETMWGITKRVAVENGYTGPMRALTREQAKSIYKRAYWDKAKADQYDGAISFQLFDAAVNHGITQAIKFLQRAVGTTADGIVGPKTLAAIAAMDVDDVLMRFNAERLQFYTDLSTWNTFGRGWARRVAGNLKYAAEDA